MTFWQFVQSHYVAIIVVLWFLFTCAVNALPAEGQPFSFGAWFMTFLREIAQQAPTRFPPLTGEQKKILAAAEVPKI